MDSDSCLFAGPPPSGKIWNWQIGSELQPNVEVEPINQYKRSLMKGQLLLLSINPLQEILKSVHQINPLPFPENVIKIYYFANKCWR